MNWRTLLRTLPKGLSYVEASRRLGTRYQTTRSAMRRYGYPASDGRTFSQNSGRKLLPEAVDWTRSNIEIAREYGVSRERVRVLRERLRKPFVESRGRPRKECSCGRHDRECRGCKS